MSKILYTPRGFRDIDSNICEKMFILYNSFFNLAQNYNCFEFKTPTLEFTDLFVRGVGEGTDVVDKEMFTFNYDDESLCLRPEGTAGLVRALINKGLFSGRFFYYSNFFRKERPQKGRYREFFSIGAEFIGRKDHLQDIECLDLAIEFFKIYNLKYILKINNIGNIESRSIYISILEKYFKENYDNLSDVSKYRFDNKKILRILDSKEDKEIIKNAPKIIDYLDSQSLDNFIKIKEFLDNKKIQYEVDPFIVRGLDYYNDLVFEFISNEFEGSQNTICGGGRYDGLFKILGGQDTYAVGFGIGLDRMIECIQLNNIKKIQISIIDELQNSESINLIENIRKIKNKNNIVFNVEIAINDQKLINKLKKNSSIIINIKNNNCNICENIEHNTKNTFDNFNLIDFLKNYK